MHSLKSGIKSLFSRSNAPPKPLSNPKNPSIDIVFVARFVPDQNKANLWLDSLQSQLPEARITIFEYDDTTELSEESLQQWSEKLTSHLKKAGKDNRPIILVANGLGAFVVQLAFKKICQSVNGLAFLDIPQGARFFEFADYIEAAHLPFPRAVGHASELLEHVQYRFEDAVRDHKRKRHQYPKVAYFYKEHPGPGVNKNPAVYYEENLHDDLLDHADMAKFVRDENSTPVGLVEELEKWVREPKS